MTFVSYEYINDPKISKNLVNRIENIFIEYKSFLNQDHKIRRKKNIIHVNDDYGLF